MRDKDGGERGVGAAGGGVRKKRNCLCNTRITLFKNLVYKNVEAQILEKIRTS